MLDTLLYALWLYGGNVALPRYTHCYCTWLQPDLLPWILTLPGWLWHCVYNIYYSWLLDYGCMPALLYLYCQFFIVVCITDCTVVPGLRLPDLATTADPVAWRVPQLFTDYYQLVCAWLAWRSRRDAVIVAGVAAFEEVALRQTLYMWRTVGLVRDASYAVWRAAGGWTAGWWPRCRRGVPAATTVVACQPYTTSGLLWIIAFSLSPSPAVDSLVMIITLTLLL